MMIRSRPIFLSFWASLMAEMPLSTVMIRGCLLGKSESASVTPFEERP